MHNAQRRAQRAPSVDRRTSIVDARSAFTLIELVFVAAISVVVFIGIVGLLSGGQRQGKKGEETLDFLRKSTLLLETLKRDIRSSKSVEGSDGAQWTVRVEQDDGPTKDIVYSYSPDERVATRLEPGEDPQEYGREGDTGFVKEFNIQAKDIELTLPSGETREISGLYLVDLVFSNPSLKTKDGEPIVRPTHRFRALVNRRMPTETDDLWFRNDWVATK